MRIASSQGRNLDTQENLVHLSSDFFYFLAYLFKEKTVYLCIAMVPIAMAAKILYCKDEAVRGEKRVKAD